MNHKKTFVIIAAAGKGIRMDTPVRKQYLNMGSLPVLSRTILAFDPVQAVDEIILVIPSSDESYCRENILSPFDFQTPVSLVEGGPERQDSVFNGLKKIKQKLKPGRQGLVMIHDGVRPFIDGKLIKSCLDCALKLGACIPAIRVTDTLKKVNDNSFVEETIDRSMVFQAQTPQTFKFDIIYTAYELSNLHGFIGTDDAALVEQFVQKVGIVNGSNQNIKITTPADLILGTYWAQQDKK